MSYRRGKELLAQIEGGTSSSKPFAEEPINDFVLDKGAKLKKNDLLKYEYYPKSKS